MEKIGSKKKRPISIRDTLVRNFAAVMIVSIVTFAMLTVIFIKQYYYKNIQELLSNQIQMSADFYNTYFSTSSLYENIMSNVDTFWNQTDAEVQIIDMNGNMIMDSIGAPKSNIVTDDIKKAMSGERGIWIGNIGYSDSKVMAISYPLKRYDDIEGVLRFVTSLKEVDNEIRKIGIIFAIIALFVIVASIGASVVVANEIINPVKSLTKAAEKMASGDFKTKSVKVRDDEIGELSDTLNYMASEIIKKDEMKNDFISNVSHELRTPLTSIKGWAVTLKYDGIDKQLMDDGLDIIEKESDRLSEMVEELLSFSKFVSGRIEIKKSWNSVHEITNYLKLHMSARAERDGIKFDIHEDDNLPDMFIDINRIKQVLINLLDNSFKFTERGGNVILKVYKNGDMINFDVIDDGCGISKEDLPHVKEKFFKGKSSKSQNGIGLSICDKLIALHGGTMDIESELGKGTRVTAMLPIDGGR